MSSPLASLGKTRRVPLQSEPVNPGRRGLKIYGNEDEVDMLNGAHGSEERISVPSCYGGIGAPVGRQVPVCNDSELVATLTRKLRDLERQVKAQTDEILSKTRKIQALEEMVETLEKHQGKVSLQRQEELETVCAKLRQQVGEMERFLGDYGLQWVGEPTDQEDSEDGERDWMTAKKFWKPGRVGVHPGPSCKGNANSSRLPAAVGTPAYSRPASPALLLSRGQEGEAPASNTDHLTPDSACSSCQRLQGPRDAKC